MQACVERHRGVPKRPPFVYTGPPFGEGAAAMQRGYARGDGGKKKKNKNGTTPALKSAADASF
eukprot:1030058-Prorocentrum_minimum.AAC.2